MRFGNLICACLLFVVISTKAQEGTFIPCVDTLNLRQKFLDGEVEEVYSNWQNYFRVAQQTRARVGRDCFAVGAKMIGVLSLRLPSHLDTTQAEIQLYTLLKLIPRAEMWDLWLPLETQGYWDSFREQYGRGRTAEEIWHDRWLPPVNYQPTKDPEAVSLRKAYHRNRLLYANARDDEENYYKIFENIRPLRDPTFTLLRTDVMLRLGMNVTQSKVELAKFEGHRSKVMSEGDLVGWAGRLAVILKDQKQSLEPKDTTRNVPVVRNAPRLKLSEGSKE